MQRRDTPPRLNGLGQPPALFFGSSQSRQFLRLFVTVQRSRSKISYSAHLKRMWLMIT